MKGARSAKLQFHTNRARPQLYDMCTFLCQRFPRPVSCPRCKQAEILAGVCGQREALERRVYEMDVQLELNLDELETTVQVTAMPNTASRICPFIQLIAVYGQ